jgi:hypothetical protein
MGRKLRNPRSGLTEAEAHCGAAIHAVEVMKVYWSPGGEMARSLSCEVIFAA